jgi:hypothetical protein
MPARAVMASSFEAGRKVAGLGHKMALQTGLAVFEG